MSKINASLSTSCRSPVFYQRVVTNGLGLTEINHNLKRTASFQDSVLNPLHDTCFFDSDDSDFVMKYESAARFHKSSLITICWNNRSVPHLCTFDSQYISRQRFTMGLKFIRQRAWAWASPENLFTTDKEYKLQIENFYIHY